MRLVELRDHVDGSRIPLEYAQDSKFSNPKRSHDNKPASKLSVTAVGVGMSSIAIRSLRQAVLLIAPVVEVIVPSLMMEMTLKPVATI